MVVDLVDTLISMIVMTAVCCEREREDESLCAGMNTHICCRSALMET